MPKVSAEHLAARRAQIVDAALRLFAQNGFHRTSMADIVAASGMSAGAVYHYFPAKNDLIDATTAAVRSAYTAPLVPLLAVDPPPPPATFIEEAVGALRDIHRGDIDFTRLGVLMWAEALTDPQLRTAVRAVQTSLRDTLAGMVIRWQTLGMVPASVSADHVAAALYGLMPGYTVQLNLLGDVSPAGFAAGVLALSGRAPST